MLRPLQQEDKDMAADTYRINIPLEGVDNEHCALIIDEALRRQDGILNHHVELNNKRAVVELKETEFLGPVVQIIRNLGYTVPALKANWPVLKMSCAGCANTVEKMVSLQPGVINDSVNYASAMLQVEYIPEMINESDIRKAVQLIGYDLDISQANFRHTIDHHGKYLLELKKKAFWAGILSFPVVLLGMFFMHLPYASEIMWVLSTPVVFWAGRSFFVNAWKKLQYRTANMDTLVAMSTMVAYCFSVYNLIFPHTFHQGGGHVPVYFEAAAVVITFILLGKVLEEKAKGRASEAIRQLIGLQPSEVMKIEAGGHVQSVPLVSVQQGDLLLVKSGEKIPVDGQVVDGSSYVDESLMTGEPIPVLKTIGDCLFAGTINQQGSFTFVAEKVGSTTMLARIIKMVQDAQGSKAPIQKLVDRVAAVFVPVVVAIAFFALLFWGTFGGSEGWVHGIEAFVTVLIIACPCALGLATPTAVMVGMGKGATSGILIRDAESLEQISRINALVLDKTGTITEGLPTVADIFWEEHSAEQISVFAGLEALSSHPLAKVMVNYLNVKDAVIPEGFEDIAGKGVRAVYRGDVYAAGSKNWMIENGLNISDKFAEITAKFDTSGFTRIWFGGAGKVYALVALHDKVKPTSVEAIRQIKDLGIRVFILSGDQESPVRKVAEETGINDFAWGLSPEEKLARVEVLQQEGLVVGMAGDGINDSAALAKANVGIAMGHGSDIAMEAARITLVSGNLIKVPEAIRLSKLTRSVIRQNLFWAFIYNVIGIPLAAGILIPVNGFVLNPMIAGAAMALSSVSVVANSLRMRLKMA
jgi:P-type Cu2+ transporter